MPQACKAAAAAAATVRIYTYMQTTAGENTASLARNPYHKQHPILPQLTSFSLYPAQLAHLLRLVPAILLPFHERLHVNSQGVRLARRPSEGSVGRLRSHHRHKHTHKTRVKRNTPTQKINIYEVYQVYAYTSYTVYIFKIKQQ